MKNLIQNPMKLMEQFNRFRASVNGDPEQMVKNMVALGKVSQEQLDEAQRMASQIQNLLLK